VWAHQDLNLGPLRYQDNGRGLRSDARSLLEWNDQAIPQCLIAWRLTRTATYRYVLDTNLDTAESGVGVRLKWHRVHDRGRGRHPFGTETEPRSRCWVLEPAVPDRLALLFVQIGDIQM
jgi:hypothetical protein